MIRHAKNILEETSIKCKRKMFQDFIKTDYKDSIIYNDECREIIENCTYDIQDHWICHIESMILLSFLKIDNVVCSLSEIEWSQVINSLTFTSYRSRLDEDDFQGSTLNKWLWREQEKRQIKFKWNIPNWLQLAPDRYEIESNNIDIPPVILFLIGRYDSQTTYNQNVVDGSTLHFIKGRKLLKDEVKHFETHILTFIPFYLISIVSSYIYR